MAVAEEISFIVRVCLWPVYRSNGRRTARPLGYSALVKVIDTSWHSGSSRRTEPFLVSLLIVPAWKFLDEHDEPVGPCKLISPFLSFVTLAARVTLPALRAFDYVTPMVL